MTDRLVPLISQQTIAETVKRLARDIDRDYGDRPPVVVGVLKGSFIFLADLIRAMQTPIKRVELIKLSSYGSGTVSSGTVSMQLDVPAEAIAGQDVILVEDIVDTGLSVAKAFQVLGSYSPQSLKLCTLLDKPDRRKVPVTIDYCGITIPDRFIVGYGIDFGEQYRQLPDIYTLERPIEA
ncbi:hypoxanthine phosphoribosyltransferase [Altericista sp. CCNU0014]|uniref:hypoxanthine phosphoribosyltransferase n=1 Tax=Altericista sp. CCNU0014 TaxID=3082949 RepID=UPI00384F0A8B